MRLRFCNSFCPIFVTVFLLSVIHCRADEGMWPYNNPPLKQLAEKYHFQPTPQWLEHLQKASVRFNSGGSGSFVSPNGLVITNHHVGADTFDPLLALAELIGGPARAARKVFDTNDETQKQAYAQFAKARFAIEGTSEAKSLTSLPLRFVAEDRPTDLSTVRR